LKGRTGVETILYTTRGSTDLPLRGIAFATEGVEEFMSSVMNIDNQDLVSKMEGFAIQGMKGMLLSCKCLLLSDWHLLLGAAKNYQKRSSEVRSAIRQLITEKLRKFSQQIFTDSVANFL
jgi:hypothetical protein